MRLGGSWLPFALPAAACTLLFILAPLAVMLGLSLAKWNLTQAPLPAFTGLGNYARLLHDAAFWSSLGITLQFTAESVALQLAMGVGIAVLFNRDWPGMGLVRALFLTPMMIAPIFVGMIWRLMLSDDFGIFRYLLLQLGITQPPLWLDDPAVALHAVAMVSAWEWTGFVVLFVLAGLQAIPGELYEAAGLDGCGSLRAFRLITLPLLAPTLAAVALFRGIDGFKTFDIIYAMTSGGPGDATATMSWFVYQQGIGFFELGYSSTLAMVMLACVIFLAAPLLRRASR